ncbi:hypothetical protein BDV36DRAFT_244586 [Aspergillus pseudocaelatus]|uniref:F-box domain-containing protein n=1 Tax=Aspergillus pseudocaelatus TaxID=1825620 RepID=A0ABQ6X0C2_9EURO|nr:hypothetical protein BDV36DRAFT_244586 [Aspergillus pseudocaelatus]
MNVTESHASQMMVTSLLPVYNPLSSLILALFILFLTLGLSKMGIATDFLAWVLPNLHLRSTQIKPPSFACSNLANLPAELLYMIADYLTPCDQACLSLCNRRLLHVFGYGPPSANICRSTCPTSLSLGPDTTTNKQLLAALRENTNAVNSIVHEIRLLSRLIHERNFTFGRLLAPKTGCTCPSSHAGSVYYSSPQNQSSSIHQAYGQM